MLPPTDIGLEFVQTVRRWLLVEDEWSIDEPRGFTWWGYSLAQRIWAEPVRVSYGFTVARVHAETAVLRQVPGGVDTVEAAAELNHLASLSAYLFDGRHGRLTSHCSVFVHEGSERWLGPLFVAAVTVQLIDAHAQMPWLARVMGGVANTSHHPLSGPRHIPADRMSQFSRLFLQSEESQKMIPPDAFEEAAAMHPHPWVLANADVDRLTAELPCGGNLPMLVAFERGLAPQTALFQADRDQPHPRLGNGLLMRLTAPMHVPGERAAAVANGLNLREVREWGSGQFLGAWCVSHDGNLTFVSFLPGIAYEPGLLGNLVLSAGLRAQWLAGLRDTIER